MKKYRLPAISREQMVRVDQLMMEEYGISLLQMMEHAGENLARLTQYYLWHTAGKQVLVLCGRGNNGGGGLVAARFLHQWGFEVSIGLLSGTIPLKAASARHVQTLGKVGLTLVDARRIPGSATLQHAAVIVDAMIGYGLSGMPRPEVRNLIQAVNGLSEIPVISLDAPSGLDVDGGPGSDVIQAAATLTLALPKLALTRSENSALVGDLYLADIGVPRELYRELGWQIGPIFSRNSILKHLGNAEYAAFTA